MRSVLTNSRYRIVVCTGHICSVAASSTQGTSISGNANLFFRRNHAFGTNPATCCSTSVGGTDILTDASCDSACSPARRSPVASASKKVTFAVKMCRDSCSSELSLASRARRTILTSHWGIFCFVGVAVRSMLLTSCEHITSSPGLYPVAVRVMCPMAARYARMVAGASLSTTSK